MIMSFVEKLIRRFYPNKIITARISDLIHDSTNDNLKNNDICIAIETDSKSRRFCYLTTDELITLYEHCPVLERCLYELISLDKHVKVYIDFEYYVNNNLDIQNSRIGSSCCLKMLYLLLNYQDKIDYKENSYIDLALKQFLVLESSTSEKVSYHFIHTNPCILFENNLTLGLFIKAAMHFFLWLIALHKCSSFNINMTLQKCSVSDLITLLGTYVKVLRTNCTKCHVYSDHITVAEIAYLLVLNKQNQYTLAIDLGVYTKNQQFRLFDCVKRNKTNSLVQSTSFSSQQYSKNSYYDILKKSLVTYHGVTNIPMLCQKENQLIYEITDGINPSVLPGYNLIHLNSLNTHLNSFFTNITISTGILRSITSNRSSQISTDISVDDFQEHIEDFRSFVEKLIKADCFHQGFIRSCVRGNRNLDLLFFNIAGEYRFCPHKGKHHERNTTTIIIDINNRTYSIRCKDPDCKNVVLNWNRIE